MMTPPKRRDIPSLPGIYFFLDRLGKPLYIGKASNLKNRLGSYFVGVKDSRIAQMIEKAQSVRWQITGSEIEALILESRYIKKHYPPFNILLRDDKQYFYVIFSKGNFPKVSLTHQPLADGDKKDIIGPFTSGTALKSSLKLMRKVMPYCTCKETHQRTCLNAQIGNCLGYCCSGLLPEGMTLVAAKREYKKNITALKQILNGKRSSFERQQTKLMMAQANSGNLESAISLRTKLEKLKQIFDNAHVIQGMEEKQSALKAIKQTLGLEAIPERIEGYDISHNQGAHATGSLVVFINGTADKSLYRKFKIRSKATPDDTAMLKEVLERRLNHSEWPMPNLILIDGGKAQFNIATAVLSRHGYPIPIISLTKNEKHAGDHIFSAHDGGRTPLALNSLPKPMTNLILEIDGEAHRFAISYYRKLHGRELGK